MKQETQLITPIRICKICFKEIKDGSFHDLLNNSAICYKCLNDLNPQFIEFEIDDIKAMAIYEYADVIKEKIFQFKGCGDYELKNVFIGPFVNELRYMYRDYEIVMAPSFKTEDKGNHVKDIFECLKLPMHDIFYKTKKHKQSDQNYFGRLKVGEFIKIKDEIKTLEGKKILMVDDICTTGSTLKACINLLKNLNPVKIKVLVVAKRIFTEKEIELLNSKYSDNKIKIL